MKIQSFIRPSVCLLGLSVAFPAFAQQGGVLEEITVTAQKREQDLQSTPVAVTAFAGGYLDRFKVDEVDDVAIRSPGVSVRKFNRSQTNITMRGAFSSNSEPLAENTFAIFVDDVYYGREYEITLDYIDIERIEVLRGPQGTLFGRNVVGGAFNIITETPDENTRGMLEFTYGEYEGTGNPIYNFAGKVSGALSDNLFGSIALEYEDEGGWSENAIQNNAELGGGELFHLRSKLRWAPSDTTDVVLSLSYQDDKGQGTPWFVVAGDPDLDPGVVRNTGPVTGGDFNDTDVAQLSGADLKNLKTLKTGSLKITHDTDWFGGSTLTSITSYRESDADFANDDLPSTSPGVEFVFSTQAEHEQFTQELRLSGETERLNWLVGAYYYNADGSSDQTFDVNFGLSGSFLNFALANGFLGNPPPFPPFPLGVDGFFSFEDNLVQRGNTESIALFTQNTYAVTDWLNATVGARWTKDDKDGRTVTVGNPFPSGVFIVTPHDVTYGDSWDAFTPKFVLDANFDVGGFDSFFTYASVSKGFKSGGFVASITPEASSTPIEPEEVWNYEVGVKTEFLDGRARLNLTYYKADYTNLQTTLIPTGARSFVTVNAGEAEAEGIELEAMFLVTDDLLLSFNYAYTDATFSSFELPGINFTGNRVAQTPENSWSFDLSYNKEIGNGEFEFLLNYAFRDDAFMDADNDNHVAVVPFSDARSLDITLSYDINDWSFSLWGKNLTDERQLFNGLPLFGQFSQSTPAEFFGGEPFITAVVSPGTSYGFTIQRRWGE